MSFSLYIAQFQSLKSAVSAVYIRIEQESSSRIPATLP
jgi:hypothetical protein